jgi:hypothetical protein
VRVWYGGYGFPENGTHWLVREDPVEENNITFASVTTVTLTGMILGDSTADVNAQIRAMRLACYQEGRDLRLVADNGQLLEQVSSVGAIIPVKRFAGPEFSGKSPTEYVNRRDFTVAFKATHPPPAGALGGGGANAMRIVGRRRSITVEGGGPSVVWLPSVNGPSQKQSPEPLTPETLTDIGMIRTRNLPHPIVPGGAIRPSAYVKILSGVGLEEEMTDYGIVYTRSWRFVYQDVIPF